MFLTFLDLQILKFTISFNLLQEVQHYFDFTNSYIYLQTVYETDN